jgi:hypothetical protein
VSEQTAPPCADECKDVLRKHWAKVCAKLGVPVPEAHITHVPPLIDTGYEPLAIRCPHGVMWHAEPTSEQIAEWVRDGVE